MSGTSQKPIVALDIGPLSERSHTGIANVAKFLGRKLLDDDDVECMFTFNRQIIDRRIAEKLLSMTGGDILWWLAGRSVSSGAPKDFIDRRIVGIYPGHKWHRRYYPFEVQIVHDLTAVLMPQYHTEETARFWEKSLFGDMASSDLIVAVSNSTAVDIRTYFPQLKDIPIVVSHLASCCTLAPKVVARPVSYIVVLGTLEPRKNILPILEFLAANREYLERSSFVFVGRYGWGDPINTHVERLGLHDAVGAGAIRFTGFVGDRVRDYLVAHSRGVMYPSLYEGFGLPVIEALSLGVPVVTTMSSSLPEVGGNVAIYCDFSNPPEIGMAIERLLGDVENSSIASRERKRWAEEFSWSKTYRRIRHAALTEYEKKLQVGVSAQENSNG